VTPHPAFADRCVAERKTLGALRLSALGIADLTRDFIAVVESAAEIRGCFPDSDWPEGLTIEQNLVDLGWHQKEFAARRSCAWVIEDAAGGYLGCAYVYPAIDGSASTEVVWWWRTGAIADRAAFRRDFLAWLYGPEWPRLDYRVVGVGGE